MTRKRKREADTNFSESRASELANVKLSIYQDRGAGVESLIRLALILRKY